jgi:chemotaxis protein methyltransferase CheR
MTGARTTAVDPAVRDAIGRRLQARFGLTFPSSRTRALETAIARTLDALGEQDPARLLVSIDRDDDRATEALIREATVGETYFFRDPQHFALLSSLVFGSRRGAVRLWSAGCATGEEPYSLAIAAVQRGLEPEVIGTDLNATFLSRARAGAYGPWSFRGVDAQTQDRWFERDGRIRRVRPEIRRRVRFSALNLVSPAPGATPREVDAIFCRNVLIYFDPPAIAAAASTLASALSKSGVLILGPSDPMLPEDAGLVSVRHAGALVYRRRDAVEAPSGPPSLDAMLALGASNDDRSIGDPSSDEAPASDRILEREASLARASRALGASERPAAGPPVTTESDLLAARRAADRGDLAEAHERLDRIFAAAPFDPEPFVLRATVRQAEGDDDGALDDLRRALLLDRDLPVAHLLTGLSLERRGDPSGAARALARARRLLADLPEERAARCAGGTSVAELRELARRGGTRRRVGDRRSR